MFCLSKTNVKIRDSPESKKSSKSNLICGLCSGEKSIMTLECRHKCCVKCYNNIKYCTQCEKDNKKRMWCWCC